MTEQRGRLVLLAKNVQKWTIAGLIGMAGAWLVVPAAADDGELCVRGSGDAAIEACTRLLKSGRFNKRNLALIYSNRANQWERKGDFDKAMQDHARRSAPTRAYAAGYMHRGNLTPAVATMTVRLPITPNRSGSTPHTPMDFITAA